MRLVAVHLDSLIVEPTHTVDESAPDEQEPPDGLSLGTCVGAFLGVETSDATRFDAVVEAADDELRDAVRQLNVDNVALLPTPHIIDTPAGEETTQAVLEAITVALEDHAAVHTAPVGWHLAVDLDAKGHPFATRSRQITGEEQATDRDPPSEWIAFSGDGTAVSVDDAALSEAVRAVVEGDESRTNRDGELLDDRGFATPDTDRLVERGFTVLDSDCEERSLRWTPAGSTLRTVIRAVVDQWFDALGATPIETPETYRAETKAVREHLAALDIEPITTGASGRVFRPTLCPGHLRALADAKLTVGDLPAAVSEIGTCHRRSHEGDRSVTVPAVHTAVANTDAAKAVIESQCSMAASLDETLGIDRTAIVRVRDPFYEAHREWIASLVPSDGPPMAVERRPAEEFGYDVSIEFVTTTSDRPRALGWVRLDRDRPEQYGVQFTDETGQNADGRDSETPPVVHCAPVGTVESLVTALLERAAWEQPSRLPTPLAPTQVRLLPVDDDHVETSTAFARALAERGVRADVDDRKLAVGARIDAAGTALVPYYAVVGDPAREGEFLRVTDRETGQTNERTVAELAELIHASCPGQPSVPRRGPIHLSDHVD